MIKRQSVLICFGLFLIALVSSAADNKDLLKQYKGDVVLPAELYQTYENLVTALEAGKQEDIEKFLEKGKIKFTKAPRDKDNREYGQDINLPFIKDGFQKYILNLRKDSDTAYLIRTGSTAFSFTKSDDGKWILSKYFDKPII